MTPDEKQTHLMTPEKFSVEVERRFLAEGPGASYIELTSAYLEELDIDAVDGKALISKSLLDKIQVEAMQRNLLKEKQTTVSLV